MSELTILSCLNSEEMAESRRVEFNLPRDVAADQGRSAVDASNAGCYRDTEGREMQATVVAVADQLASVAELASGKVSRLKTGGSGPARSTATASSNELFSRNS